MVLSEVLWVVLYTGNKMLVLHYFNEMRRMNKKYLLAKLMVKLMAVPKEQQLVRMMAVPKEE